MSEPHTVSGSQPSLTGEVQFFDNYIPVLHDGDYEISVTQAFKSDKVVEGGFPADESFTETQKFTITGPRFSLNPADVHREFPPPNHQGRFEAVLPHITLRKRALPWERKVFANDATPWLALLVFAEDEILNPIIGTALLSPSAPNPTKATSILLEELTDPPASPVVVCPDVTFDPYEQPSKALCSVIDIAPETFKAVVPNQADLAYLSHGRKVNIENKSATVTVEAPGSRVEEGTQWFATVISGRFPEAPVGPRATAPAETNGDGPPPTVGKNIAHLVTLEGFETYVGASASSPGAAFPADAARVRLVSLASWTFTSLPVTGESFADLMWGLVPGTDSSDRDELLLRLPSAPLPSSPTAEQTYAHNALTSGYTARRYATRQGENTFAWYRGPFAPSLPERFPDDRTPFSVSGQAIVYDKDKGLFDMSYGAAFEIGRLAAIHSGALASALISWRSRGRQLLDKIQHRVSSSALQSLFSTLEVNPEAEQVLQHALLTHTFMEYLTTAFTETVLPQVHAPNPQRPQHVTTADLPSDQTENPAQELAEALANPEVAAFLQNLDQDGLAPILKGLAKLYLLYGVPFEYLVPDERMLPGESIRFFYIDRNWLDALIDGAMSVGVHTGIEAQFQTTMTSVIREGLHELMHQFRDQLLGITDPQPNDAGDSTFAGVLIRSAVVSGWPGLEVHAQDASGQEIGLLRMDHLGPNVLLCLFASTPAAVFVNEPQEGLHFGLESNDAVYLRYLSGDKVGYLLDPEQTITVEIDASRMMNIPKALADMKAGLGLSTDLGPADFAVQMVDVPERFAYEMPTS